MSFLYPRLRESLPLLSVGLILVLMTVVARATVPAAPNNISASVISASTTSTVYVTVDDNSTNETGFDIALTPSGQGTQHIQIASGSGSTNATTAGTGNVILALSLANNTTFSIQVASYITNTSAGNISTYTSAITLTTADFNTPNILSATATSETALRFLVVDNAAGDAGQFYEYVIPPTSAYTVAASVAANVSSLNFSGWEPGTAYQFRVRGFKGTAANPTSYTSYSNVISVTTPFNAPSGLTATATSATQVNLSWTDNSQIEGGYAVYARLSGSGSYTFLSYTAANATTYSVTGLSPGTAYDFQVAAAYQPVSPRTTIIESAHSNTATGTTKDVFTSLPYIEFGANYTYTYQAATTTGVTRTSWNAATGLPTGMSFSTSTGAITGTPTQYGLFTATLSATFTGGWTATLPVRIRVVRPPVTATTIAAQILTTGGNTSVTLSDKFSDPDAESAVRVKTNIGTMDFILFNTATPQTVTNFLSYVNAATNNYNGSVFHRSVPGFIVQGGAFKVSSAPNNFSVTTTSASPTNEPGVSNLRGTVAMAKLGTDPNSATDQFFVNLADNSSNLDNQNGGFTAFARVAGSGMTVADAIAGLPNATYSVNLGGTTTSMDNWPLTSSSASMDTTKVVSITSAAPVAVLSYSVTGNTNSAVASATISGTNVQINALSAGQTNVTVTATDLDGNTVTQTFAVTVNQMPAITNGPPASIGLVGSAYTIFTYTTTGTPAPTFSVTAGALPGGLSLSTAGVISGTPTASGIFAGTVTASNVAGSVTQNFSITVNQPPAFTSSAPTTTGLVGSAYTFNCTASGFPAPTFSVTTGVLPTGLSLSSAGAVTGTPTVSGVFSGVITANNGIGTAATQNFNMTINQTPTFTSAAPTSTGKVGTAYSFSCAATGFPAPTFSVTAGALPTGLSLSSAGAITGTPSAVGTFTGTITATNTAGTVPQSFSITINQVPAFTSSAPTTTGILGVAYSFTCTGSGTPAPTFSVTAGALPTGLTMSTDGTITGTPSALGTFTGTTTATNAAGTVTQNFSITINQVPAFTSSTPTATSLINTAYSFTVTASGAPAPTFSVTAGALPTGLTLSSAGAITGTATASGLFTGTITATNVAGTATQNFSIAINQPPTFTNGPPPTSGLMGTAYSFSYTAAGFPVPTFIVTTGALPSGLSLSTMGAITGTPTATGVFTGTVTASNSIGTAATQNFSITVSQAVANWAASQGLSGANALPDADPDHDGLTNLQEFAFMTNANSGTSNAGPSFTTTPGATKYGEITFPVRKFTSGLTYYVEASDTLVSNSWTTVWISTDGFSASTVSAYTDLTDRTVVTIRDTVASPPATRRFLRVKVSSP